MTSAPQPLAKAALWVLALAALPLPAAAQVRVSSAVTDIVQGLFCAPDETGRREAPDTLSGWIHVPDHPIQMVAEGAVAPAVLGMGFGVRFRRAGSELAVLSYVVTHPPMTNEGITRQGWESLSQAGEVDAIFFQFDVEEELVPGQWAFAAYLDDIELFHAPFTVVDPSQALELLGLCQGGSMLSVLRP